MIVRSCNVFVQLIYRALNFCGHSKDYELWRLSMEERCRAGYHVAPRRTDWKKPIDVFHKNPAHQRRMLDGFAGVHRATIRIGGRAFDLTVAPLKGGAGMAVERGC